MFSKLAELQFKISLAESVRDVNSVSAILPTLSNKCFPKLKFVHLDFEDRDVSEEFIRERLWGACDTPLETVDKLELHSYSDPQAMKYLANVFPRVTHVVLSGLKFYESDLSHIWNLQEFPHLSKLEIRGFPFRNGIMDSFLTGISADIIAMLPPVPQQGLSSLTHDNLGLHPSILRLTSRS